MDFTKGLSRKDLMNLHPYAFFIHVLSRMDFINEVHTRKSQSQPESIPSKVYTE